MLLENRPFFSIIVPVYNVEKYIEQCVKSVLEQSFCDYELILVDDGSADRTGKICDDFTKNRPHSSIVPHHKEKVNSKIKQPLIKVIHQANAGLSAARNTGVSAATGEYLIFLDGDDYLHYGALMAIWRNIEPKLDLLRYQAQEVFPDGHKIRYEESGFATTSGVEAFNKLARYHYTENAWLYAYRRDFFVGNNFQYAEGRHAEDFGLTPLVIAKAASVKAISNICYNYRQREGSLMHDPSTVRPGVYDMLDQLQVILPKIAKIHGAKPISHYLVVSFLTGATNLGRAEFLQVYRKSKQAGLLKYIHPASLRALPRAFILKHLPKSFYRIYHLNKTRNNALTVL